METQDDAMHKYMVALNDVIQKPAGNIDCLTTELKLMTSEMKQIKDANKELRKICAELREENTNAKK